MFYVVQNRIRTVTAVPNRTYGVLRLGGGVVILQLFWWWTGENCGVAAGLGCVLLIFTL